MKKMRALPALVCAALLLPLLLISCSPGDVMDFLSALSSLAAEQAGTAVPDESGTGGAPAEDSSGGHVHAFSETSRTEPSCEETGVIVYACVCGEESSEILDAKGHFWVLVRETVPGCETDGIKTYGCRNCGASKTEPGSPRTGHSFVFTKRVAPTYESGGYDLYTCAGCGAEERRNATAPLVHNEASYTDRCTMTSYLTSAMPGETPRDALSLLLSGVLTTTGVRADLSPYTHDQVYAKLKEGHNYLPRNAIFGSTGSKMSMYSCSDEDLGILRSDLAWTEASVKSLGINTSTTQREAMERINVFLCEKLRYDYSDDGNIEVHRAIDPEKRTLCLIHTMK